MTDYQSKVNSHIIIVNFAKEIINKRGTYHNPKGQLALYKFLD